jgi:hypothetical protein
MQPLVIDANRAAQIVAEIDALGAMRTLFAGLHAGKVAQPPQTLTLLPDGSGGDFITYIAALADPPVFGAKLSPYLPRPGGGLVTAWTLLMSSETGAPLMLCDSLAITRERTAATTALGRRSARAAYSHSTRADRHGRGRPRTPAACAAAAAVAAGPRLVTARRGACSGDRVGCAERPDRRIVARRGRGCGGRDALHLGGRRSRRPCRSAALPTADLDQHQRAARA